MESDKTSSTEDPALNRLLQRMPPEVAKSFTEEQLSHLHSVLGARSWKKHSLDIRSTFPVPFVKRRIYFVLLMGRNRRDLTRQEKQISAFTFALVIMAFITISTFFGLMVLYLVKWKLGIDLFPESNFKLGHWFWDLWK
ncbi:hypothetical protein [Aestuariibacter sp. A3R04]|uniref:hypothetical protein n=1 Tax=Aestuariibacter sp. A3R04 TaxID=2841571 RepID=UPI00352E2984